MGYGLYIGHCGFYFRLAPAMSRSLAPRFTHYCRMGEKEIPLPVVMISMTSFAVKRSPSANSASIEALQAVVNQNFTTWLVNQQWAASAPF